MGENKYYTPEIDEFYVGFKFEYKDPHYDGRKEFRPCIIKDAQTIKFTTNLDQVDGFNEIDHEHLLSNIEYEIEHGGIRVKYLDKQDLIELGFEQQKFHGVECFQFKIYLLYYFDGIHVVSIDTLDGFQTFRGEIKNKSELIKVLKMLGIK